MASAKKLAAKVKNRLQGLQQKKTSDRRSTRNGHVTPCASNFDYKTVSSGSEKAKDLILREIRGE